MKIQSVEVTNYKAFLGTYELKFGAKMSLFMGEMAVARARSIMP
jgi:hypothetical protein